MGVRKKAAENEGKKNHKETLEPWYHKNSYPTGENVLFTGKFF